MASAFSDEDRPIPRPVHEVGQDLATLSIDEIEVRIELLREEIARLEAAKAAKSMSRTAADAFFKR